MRRKKTETDAGSFSLAISFPKATGLYAARFSTHRYMIWKARRNSGESPANKYTESQTQITNSKGTRKCHKIMFTAHA